MSAANDQHTPTVITLSGPLNASVVPTIRSKFSLVSRRVVIDLRTADSIDTSALREFIRLRNHIGPEIAIVAQTGSIIYQTLQVLGFAKVFRIVESLPDALLLWQVGSAKAFHVNRYASVPPDGSEPA